MDFHILATTLFGSAQKLYAGAKTIGAGGTMACSQGGGACAAHTKAANLATAATFAAATTARAATAAQGSNIGRIQSSSRRQGRQSPTAAQHGHRWFQHRMVVQQSI